MMVEKMEYNVNSIEGSAQSAYHVPCHKDEIKMPKFFIVTVSHSSTLNQKPHSNRVPNYYIRCLIFVILKVLE